MPELSSNPHLRPVLDFDSRHDPRAALAVGSEYQRLAIRHPGRQLRKRTRQVWQVRHEDRVGARGELRHLLLQPCGLGLGPALTGTLYGGLSLHTLTVI